MFPTKKQIIEAHQRIKPYIHKTPLLCSSAISEMGKCKSIVLKCENFQKVGAFKPRGAANKLLKLPNDIKSVCCHSSGNHAQAIAYMASQLGLKSYIVMPENSPLVKKNATIEYGGTVIQSGNTIKEREEKCAEMMKKYGAELIHAYNDLDIVEGQATVAKEVFQERGDFDYIVFPIGGGGLASGTLLSTKYFGKKCKPIGVEPYLARDAKISLKKKQRQEQFPPISIADGLRTSLGTKTFQIISSFLSPQDIILVEEKQIIDATRLVLERMKILIEPSSATTVAAVLKDPRFTGKRVCCIITGGNMDMSSHFSDLMQRVKM